MVLALASVIKRSEWKEITLIVADGYHSMGSDLARSLGKMENEIDHRYIRVRIINLPANIRPEIFLQHKQTKGKISFLCLILDNV